MVLRCGSNYHFLETERMTPERETFGWQMDSLPPYVHTAGKSDAREILDADVVITGSAPEALLRQRILAGKLVFRYAERPLKHGGEPSKYLPRLLRWNWRNPPGKPIYLLCASAYTSLDYRRFGLFRNRAYQWGYFPETRRYPDIHVLLDAKKPARLLWAGRLLNWKHPDDALKVARRLLEAGYSFQMDIIGTGEMEEKLQNEISEWGLESCVNLLGARKPEQVREHMERDGIFLFTSDRREGWGAVLNEAMNSGCAVIASHLIGAVPYLMKNGENGLVYESGNVDMLYEKARYLLDYPEEQRKLGAAAYRTITGEWNAEIAAQRLIHLSEHILAGEKSTDLYASGPCSRAEILKESWFKG